jgi:hypothetical protein
MWMTPGCSLPDDDVWIMRRMRCGEALFKAVVLPVISEFMLRKAGRVLSPRLQREFKKADETYKARSAAGKKGGRPQVIDNIKKDKKAGFVFDKGGPKQLEPEPEPYKEERNTAVFPKKTPSLGSRISPDFLPDFQTAIDIGLSPSQAQSESSKFKDYWTAKAGAGATKRDWPATWRVWCRTAVERTPYRQGSPPFSAQIEQPKGIAAAAIRMIERGQRNDFERDDDDKRFSAIAAH